MPRSLYVICIVLVFAIGVLIVAVNAEKLGVELLLARVELTAGQWLVIAFVLGWGAGVFSAWRFVKRLTQERADLRRSLRLAEAELRNVRPVSRDGA